MLRGFKAVFYRLIEKAFFRLILSLYFQKFIIKSAAEESG